MLRAAATLGGPRLALRRCAFPANYSYGHVSARPQVWSQQGLPGGCVHVLTDVHPERCPYMKLYLLTDVCTRDVHPDRESSAINMCSAINTWCHLVGGGGWSIIFYMVVQISRLEDLSHIQLDVCNSPTL
jgi:hypothetical protein